MSVSTIVQVVSAASNVLLAIVFAAGYYILIRIYRRMTYDMERQRTAMGRPQVVVTDNYDDLPHVSIVVRNLSQGAAKNIQFEFSAPVECSDGFAISDLPYFRDGLDFLSPNGEVSAYWDDLNSLLPLLRERGLEDGIKVTTRYKDLAGESYETEWSLNPFIYSANRFVYSRGVPDLVDAVEKLSGEVGRGTRYKMDPLETSGRSQGDGADSAKQNPDDDSHLSHEEGKGGAGLKRFGPTPE